MLFPSYSKTTLVSLCTTRWVERHDAVVRFVELFPAILQALDTLEQVSDPDTSNKADILRRRVKECEFVVNTLIIKFVAAAMLTLKTNLEKVTNNSVTVCDLVQDDTRLLEAFLLIKKIQRLQKSLLRLVALLQKMGYRAKQEVCDQHLQKILLISFLPRFFDHTLKQLSKSYIVGLVLILLEL